MKQKKIGFVGTRPNEKGTYAVVNEEGKILDKFRTKGAAIGAKPKLKSYKSEKLKIIRLLPKVSLRFPK